MAPSQLAQLKSALSTSGLSRASAPKKSKSKGKAGQTAKDREKRQARLDEIRTGLNRFDVRENRVKSDVGGKGNKAASKGVSGKPAESRSKGLEQRRATLLPEHHLRKTAHTGAFLDRRFGEGDASMTPEQRALERFTRQQEAERRSGLGSGAAKRARFNLNDDDEDGLGIGSGLGFGDDGGDDGNHLGATLTHGGRSIDELRGDDFVAQGLGDDDDDDDIEDDFGLEHTRRRGEAPSGSIEGGTVKRSHFGGFGEEDGEDEPDRKKTKAEVMAEVIAKSKTHKYQRQQLKALDDDLREELDADLSELRSLLAPSAQAASVYDPRRTGTNDVPLGTRPAVPGASTADAAAVNPPTGPPAADADKTAAEMDYDQYVRSLAFEARAKPKDRTKTEDELAKEEAERLEAAERERVRRMQGLGPDEDEVDGKGRGKKARRAKKRDRAPEGDDLSDDFVLSGEEDDEDEDEFGLGAGLEEEDAASDEDEGEDDDEESGSEDEDEDEEDEEDASEDDDLQDGFAADGSDGEDLAHAPLVPTKHSRSSAKQAAAKEIPYTFPCPADHAELLDILEGLAEADVEIVVKRIRALYHSSLGEGNKERLQTLLGVVLDHMLYLAGTSGNFAVIDALVPHVVSLVDLNPIAAAGHFTSKLALMQANLVRGINRGVGLPDSKTFPGLPELVLLRLIGLIWSTSDFSNPVGAPAELLIGQYLGQSRIRSSSDIASGLFLCSLILQYEAFSKRLVPEAINFVASVLILLAPSACDLADIGGHFPDSSPRTEDNRSLRIRPKAASDLKVSEKADVLALITASESTPMEQDKLDLAATAVRVAAAFADLLTGLDAFLEVFKPLEVLILRLTKAKLPAALMTVMTGQMSTLTSLVKSAAQSRRPLAMQQHKAVAIPTYTPKFESNFSGGKHYDTDAERNAAAKLKALYKKEKKGAIRELRKDNKFLAGEKARERKEKDQEYEKRMRRVEGEIRTTERAEEKAMEREKARDKRRSGR